MLRRLRSRTNDSRRLADGRPRDHEIRVNFVRAMGFERRDARGRACPGKGIERAEARTCSRQSSAKSSALEHLSEWRFLRVARLPQPRMEAEDLASAVREIVEFATPEIENAGCSVALHVATSLPPALFDEAQLRQALLNLSSECTRSCRRRPHRGQGVCPGEGMSVVPTCRRSGHGCLIDPRPRTLPIRSSPPRARARVSALRSRGTSSRRTAAA